MLTYRDLSEDQRAAYDGIKTWLNRGTVRQTLTLAGYAGCLSGSTVVKYNRGSRLGYREISLRNLYLKFNGFAVPGQRGSTCRWQDVTLPTYMLSLWDDGTVAGNRIVAVFESGTKPVFRVTLSNGVHVDATADHPIATPAGYVKVSDLAVRDAVIGCGTLLAGGGQGRRLDLRPPRVIVNTKYHKQGAYKAVWCNGVKYEYVRVARARLVVEAAMNGFPYEEYVHALKHNAELSNQFKFLSGDVDVHHMDENTLNDDISNLEVLPGGVHARLHGDAAHARFKKDWTRKLTVKRTALVGDEMTYDVQMEPPANNFVANGIFVHNSGKSSVVSVLAHELPRAAFCAFTGKASSVLGRKLAEAGVSTISRTVKRSPDEILPVEPRPYCGTIHGLIYRPCEVCMAEEVDYEHTFGPDCTEPRNVDDTDDADGDDVDGSDPFGGLEVGTPGGPCLACHPPPPKRKKDGPCLRCRDARFLRREALDRQYGVLVIDESSMVSDETLEDLKRFGVPILGVGDHGQLPPVRGLGSLMKHPDLRLEKIHRQAEGNPIIMLSKRIRETGDVDDALEDGEHFTILSARKMRERLEQHWAGDRFSNALGSAAIAWTNRARCSLNHTIREVLGRDGSVPQVGEVLICLKNTPPVYNGMRGILVSNAQPMGGGKTPKLRVTVDFIEDGVKAVDILVSEHQFFAEKTIDYDAMRELGASSMAQLGQLYDFGYAMTCHKMQGSQADDVLVLEEAGMFRMSRDERTRWCYTAATRAAKRLVWVRG